MTFETEQPPRQPWAPPAPPPKAPGGIIALIAVLAIVPLVGALAAGILLLRNSSDSTFDRVGIAIGDGAPAPDPTGLIVDAPPSFAVATFEGAVNGSLSPEQLQTLITTGSELVGVDAETETESIRAVGRTWVNAQSREVVVILVMGFPGSSADTEAFLAGAEGAAERAGLAGFDPGISDAKGFSGQYPQVDGSTLPGHQVAAIRGNFATTILWLGVEDPAREGIIELARRQVANLQ